MSLKRQTVIAEYLKILINDFNENLYDLKAMEFSSWLTQTLLTDLSAVSEQCQQELCELQQDEFIKTYYKTKGTMMWMSKECKKKYPNCSTLARQKLISFLSSYLVWSNVHSVLLQICCMLREIN